MARRRHRRRSHSRREHGLNKFIVPSSFALAFLQQITAKDVAASSTFAGLDPVSKLQFVVGDAIGRLTTWYPFPNLTGTPTKTVTVNLGNAINTWSGLGLAGILATKFLPLPFKSQIRKASKGFLAGGVIAGIFDDPAYPQNQTSSMIQNTSFSTKQTGTAGGVSTGSV